MTTMMTMNISMTTVTMEVMKKSISIRLRVVFGAFPKEMDFTMPSTDAWTQVSTTIAGDIRKVGILEMTSVPNSVCVFCTHITTEPTSTDRGEIVMQLSKEHSVESKAELRLRGHTFSAWTTGPIGKAFRLNIGVRGAGSHVRWFTVDGFADKPSAMEAAENRLEDALRFLAPALYRADHATMMKSALRAGDERAALTEAWAVLSALPEPIARQVWEFRDGTTGEPFLLRTQELVRAVYAVLSDNDEAYPDYSRALELLPMDRLRADISTAVSKCPELIGMADGLVSSVALGISAYADAAKCSERAQVQP